MIEDQLLLLLKLRKGDGRKRGKEWRRGLPKAKKLIQKENIVANAAEIGAYLVDQFRAQLVEQNVIVRGFGMMIGIELPKDCAELVNIARDKHHLIINVTSGNVVRLLPALNMNHEQADDLLKRLVPAIKEFLA